ncbi:tRNA uridine(34) hydroxylase [Buchnera aphidicola (Protaphis terricola)]|uniref:oxygen-dependent tRNA uridine(34) hydroxylase TrhO n=1 Tax=Buchnera aphidicola TaxID=9 RepID=UPI0034642DD9
MAVLYNRISRKELKKNIFLNKKSYFILSFYKYFYIKTPQDFRDEIYKNFLKYNILGRIYISHEGINAQISIPINKYLNFKNFLFNFHPELNNIFINKTYHNGFNVFFLLSVKIKKYIINDGIKNTLFNFKNIGIYIEAKQVNKMLYDKNTIFIDMRNSYEYEIGHFPNAIQINSKTFRDQLKHVIKIMDFAKNKKIVMYCTGGIRCEKATSWMIFHGFKYVYHIKNGIIGYVNDAKKNKLPIYFKGSNFVFDARMSQRISKDIISFCKQCKKPSANYVNCAFNLCHLLFIQCSNCAIKFKNCCSLNCIQNI